MSEREKMKKELRTKEILGKETVDRSNNNVRSLNEYIASIKKLKEGFDNVRLGTVKELSVKKLIGNLNHDTAADVTLKLWTPSRSHVVSALDADEEIVNFAGFD